MTGARSDATRDGARNAARAAAARLRAEAAEGHPARVRKAVPMTRKRKVFYPPSRSSKGAAPAVPSTRVVPDPSVAINRQARLGRGDIVAGSSVRILGTGLYAGEVAVVERLTGGVIPAATVRTSAGRTRQVRTIDLEPVFGPAADVVLD